MDRGIVLDLGRRRDDPAVAALLDRLRRARHRGDRQIRQHRVRHRQRLRRRRRAGRAAVPIMVTACGEAAQLDREHALRKALLEFAAARVRKAATHGPIDALRTSRRRGYLDRRCGVRHAGRRGEPGLRAMVEWLGLDAATSCGAAGRHACCADRSQRALSTLPTSGLRPLADSGDRLAMLAAASRRRAWRSCSSTARRRTARRARGQGDRARPRESRP